MTHKPRNLYPISYDEDVGYSITTSTIVQSPAGFFKGFTIIANLSSLFQARRTFAVSGRLRVIQYNGTFSLYFSNTIVDRKQGERTILLLSIFGPIFTVSRI